jgi:hypothetical protein
MSGLRFRDFLAGLSAPNHHPFGDLLHSGRDLLLAFACDCLPVSGHAGIAFPEFCVFRRPSISRVDRYPAEPDPVSGRPQRVVGGDLVIAVSLGFSILRAAQKRSWRERRKARVRSL